VPYHILEVSADLRERQRETLVRLAPECLGSIQWLEELPRAPLQGIVLANEVADALPVSRFVMRDGRVLAEGVVESGETFAWAAREPSAELLTAVIGISGQTGIVFPDGYRSEISLRLRAWLGAVAGALDSGVILLCDYGMSRREYYHRERQSGTLICHYRHRAHGNPFLYPGLQDVTAWVDFTAVAEAAEAAGLRVAGYSTQAHFLLDAGLASELAAASPPGTAAGLQTAEQAKKLLLPGEMGEHFKVMALTRGETGIAGFGFRDLRHML
jgi:SAM-dependent MidA family methyltransferase